MVAKRFGIYIFLGVVPTHFLKITKKFTIIVIHVRKITLHTVMKRLLPYLEFLKRAIENDQKFDWLSKIIPYLTEKHFLLQNKLLNGAHYVSCRWNCRLPKNSR